MELLSSNIKKNSGKGKKFLIFQEMETLKKLLIFREILLSSYQLDFVKY